MKKDDRIALTDKAIIVQNDENAGNIACSGIKKNLWGG